MSTHKRVEVKLSQAGYDWLTAKAAAISTGDQKVDLSDVIRLALTAYAEGAVDFTVAPHGGKRSGAGRKPTV